ncbi:MAG: tRNA guanosine(34) transglycosylase Tgt [bacterium]
MSRQLKIVTPHGRLTTPFFMPDATRGYVKAVDNQDLEKVGVEAMVVNTLHLYLQPGLKIIKKAGGIHQFINWPKPLLSDSGGYQVFSLIHKNPRAGKVLKDKVIFQSPIDGSKHELTPEKSIQIQFDLGVDMMVCLDDCPPNDYSKKEIAQSVIKTIAWAKRCRVEYDKQVKIRRLAEKKKRPLLFGVIQGGNHRDLRKYCAEELIKLDFDGYGFGARHHDADKKFLGKILQYTANLIPENKIRFALGIGAPQDIVRCYKMGWDIFDCVIPTREARHGKLYLPGKTINIMNAKYKNDFSLIGDYSKAYLNHLFKNNELTGLRLATLTNLEFYNKLIRKIQTKI